MQLQGVRIVVTRAAHQAEELGAALRHFGAEVICLPLIAILPPRDPEALARAAAEVDGYDTVVFTSANAVNRFMAARPANAPLPRASIAAVGAATRRAAEDFGLRVTLTPSEYVAESLVEALGEGGWQGRQVLIPRAAAARDLVPDELRRRGAEVTVVEAYRNDLPPEAVAQASEIFRAPLPHWVLLASPSAVENLIRLISVFTLRQMRLGSIGPVTSAAIRAAGLPVAAEATPHTAAGLVAAVLSADAAAD